MSCIPDSGGCERRSTDALVAHLNTIEGSRYHHQACLDRHDRTRKQPECLYVDAGNDNLLVIERKSIMWPEAYAHGHSKDHELAKAVSAGLLGVDFQDVYILKMPRMSTSARRQDLSTIGRAVAQEIRARYPYLKANQVLQITCGGHSFEFCLQPLRNRDEFGPTKGLCFSWNWPQQFKVQINLRFQLNKIYEDCEAKFAGYANHRRILMLDPHGDVAFWSTRQWFDVFMEFPPRPTIDEIWIGSCGDDGFGEEEWVVEKVFGGNLLISETLPGLLAAK